MDQLATTFEVRALLPRLSPTSCRRTSVGSSSMSATTFHCSPADSAQFGCQPDALVSSRRSASTSTLRPAPCSHRRNCTARCAITIREDQTAGISVVDPGASDATLVIAGKATNCCAKSNFRRPPLRDGADAISRCSGCLQLRKDRGDGEALRRTRDDGELPIPGDRHHVSRFRRQPIRCRPNPIPPK